MVVKERHYSNTEIQELADIAYRNLTLTQGFAMDPLIEKCIIGKSRIQRQINLSICVLIRQLTFDGEEVNRVYWPRSL